MLAAPNKEKAFNALRQTEGCQKETQANRGPKTGMDRTVRGCSNGDQVRQNIPLIDH
jgi:hypothetical protein